MKFANGSAAIVFMAVLFLVLGCSGRTSEPVTREFWPGVTLLVPADAEIEYDDEWDAYDIYLPNGQSVSLEKWLMPRHMWRLSTKKVAAAFRPDGQQAKTFTARARGNTITFKGLLRSGWLYERMVRLNRAVFIEANTVCGRREWGSVNAVKARSVVDSLKVR